MFNLFAREAYTMVQVVDNKTVCSRVYGTLEDAKQKAYRIMQKQGLKIKKSYNNFQSNSYICQNNVEFHINRA
jgi:hypothetical protein